MRPQLIAADNGLGAAAGAVAVGASMRPQLIAADNVFLVSPHTPSSAGGFNEAAAYSCG